MADSQIASNITAVSCFPLHSATESTDSLSFPTFLSAKKVIKERERGVNDDEVSVHTVISFSSLRKEIDIKMWVLVMFTLSFPLSVSLSLSLSSQTSFEPYPAKVVFSIYFFSFLFRFSDRIPRISSCSSSSESLFLVPEI